MMRKIIISVLVLISSLAAVFFLLPDNTGTREISAVPDDYITSERASDIALNYAGHDADVQKVTYDSKNNRFEVLVHVRYSDDELYIIDGNTGRIDDIKEAENTDSLQQDSAYSLRTDEAADTDSGSQRAKETALSAAGFRSADICRMKCRYDEAAKIYTVSFTGRDKISGELFRYIYSVDACKETVISCTKDKKY